MSGLCHLAILRSPYAHARIIRIDTEKARKAQGVIKVVTGADLVEMLDPFPKYPNMPNFSYAKCYPLAVDRVMFQGEPVVAIVAESIYAANDALEEVEVEYERLKPVLSIEQSRSKDVILYENWNSNTMLELKMANGNVDDAFAHCDLIVEGKVHVQRQCAAPLECRGYVASYEPATKGLVLHGSTQRQHPMKTFLSGVLRLPESNIRVIQSSVGGGFGLKTTPHREEALVCALSMLIGRPVKWFETRTENLMSTHSRESDHEFRAAVNKDGRVLAIQDEMYVDFGSYFPQPGVLQALATCENLTGPYDIRNVQVQCHGMTTNKAPYYPYRGFGEETAVTIHERLMDLVAEKLNMNKADVRRINIIKSSMFPYRSPTGSVYDSGNYDKLIDSAVELSGFRELSKHHSSISNNPLGFGLSVFVNSSGASAPNSFLQAYAGATVRVDTSGHVTVITGLSFIGSGSETGIAQIVADELGVKLEDVDVLQGDTLTFSFGLGTYGSGSLILAGSSAQMAAKSIKTKVLKVAAYLLKTKQNELEIRDGVVHSRTSSNSIAVAEIATKLHKDIFRLPQEFEPGLEATSYFRPPSVSNIPDEHGHMNRCTAYSSGAVATVVELVRETGEIKLKKLLAVVDCGKVVNPALVSGQVIGGVIQGLGSSIYEEVVYNEDGIQLNPNFMDYLIPSAADTPAVEVSFSESISPNTPLGSKGVGELGIQGVQAAILGAVNDALGMNVVSEFPINPEQVWKALRS